MGIKNIVGGLRIQSEDNKSDSSVSIASNEIRLGNEEYGSIQSQQGFQTYGDGGRGTDISPNYVHLSSPNH